LVRNHARCEGICDIWCQSDVILYYENIHILYNLGRKIVNRAPP
jgi:hypothetical protein